MMEDEPNILHHDMGNESAPRVGSTRESNGGSLVDRFKGISWRNVASRCSRRKEVEHLIQERKSRGGAELERVLGASDLVYLGMGSIIGAGIFVLTGVAAREKAGPGIILSYLFSGVSCMFAALCYAEFACRIPVAGSAYVYAYSELGELTAWMISWNLILEYTVGLAAVARGWAGYLNTLFGGHLPSWMVSVPLGGPFNISMLAPVSILILSMLLVRGIQGSSRMNIVITILNLGAVFIVIFAGISHVNSDNYTPFLPFGASGVFSGAATTFFAYIGFDAVSTAAEEVKNPKRNLPIGILLSLGICVVLYMIVSVVVVGMTSYDELDEDAPLAESFIQVGWTWAAVLVSLGAFAGLTTSILASLIAQPRIFFSMATDGLLPPIFKQVHPVYKTPYAATVITGVSSGITAFLFDIEFLADMVSIGTLVAFTIVSASSMVLRYRQEGEGGARVPLKWISLLMSVFFVLGLSIKLEWHVAVFVLALLAAIGAVIYVYRDAAKMDVSVPDDPDHFSVPAMPFIPIASMACNIYMMISLPAGTWVRLVIWSIIGFSVYFSYSQHHSALNSTKEKESPLLNETELGTIREL